MVDLVCTPFVELIDRMRLEFANQQSMFDLPLRKWYLPPTSDSRVDLSVIFHGQRCGNALGPASGPQTQMAQNLVLSWLAGGRIMELKTVQTNDQLKISRPCIDAANVGYNVEWSQELPVPASLDQYVQGAMLIHMLRRSPETFGRPFGDMDLGGVSGEPIYDMSLGYDLAGIRSAKVRAFLDGMIDAAKSVQRLRNLIPRRLSELRDLDFPTRLSNSVTLSTFHGCPADEIERICEFLLSAVGVHTIVKMNPPMLGKDRLEHLLYDVMGYHEITVHEEAYTSGLQFEQASGLCQRLTHLAKSHGLHFGAKFSNTLEVENHRDVFDSREKVMYLSGAPLHVITLTLAHEFRQIVGAEMPISFSAGVDRKNFANLVACGFTPITTCTDLLKVGGYGRLPHYLHQLQQEMQTVGAANIDDFVCDCRGQRAAAGGDPRRAGFLNTPLIARETQVDRRYAKSQNSKVPRKIDSHLVLFDCISCDKCIPVCPNDANFVYETVPVDVTYRDVQVSPDGSLAEVGPEKHFRIARQQQIANFADYCNHCGNCDTFCPEYDGPYLMKPSFFGSREAFDAGAPHDGFLVEQLAPTEQLPASALRLVARIAGRRWSLTQLGSKGEQLFEDDAVCLHLDADGRRAISSKSPLPATPHCMDMGRFHAMANLLAGITNLSRIHPVNTSLAQDRTEDDE